MKKMQLQPFCQLKVLNLLILISILSSQVLFSQNPEPCGFGAIMEIIQQDPACREAIEEFELSYEEGDCENNTPYLIPLVFHVMHNGGPENISEEQIDDAVAQLNLHFAGGEGGFNTLIQFSRATIDPNGNCTNGINRIQTNNPNGNLVPADDIILKNLSRWPVDRYVNVWVVRCILPNANCPNIGAVSGYAYLPFTSGLTPETDGIVVLHDYLGTIGTAVGHENHTLTHEMGHYLGLFHIWGQDFGNQCLNNCFGVGDLVGDTPICHSAIVTADCLDIPTNCEDFCGLPPGGPRYPFENYMSYGGNCRSEFTQCQSYRMKSILDGVRPALATDNNLTCFSVGSNIVIESDVDWTTANLPNGGEITLDKITVKPGNTLTIGPGVVVHFRRCDGSNFIVERNAKLILQGKLTNTTCNPNDFWYGVEVAGVNIFQGAFNDPGEIVTESGAEIENAEFGIRNRAVINGITYTGGKIICQGTKFTNNKTGVRFYHWTNIDKPNPGPWGLPDDDSMFEDCVFSIKNNGVLSALGGKLNSHIYMQGIRGILIKNSIFENLLQSSWKGAGIGVYASDSGFDVEGDGSQGALNFRGLTYGIQTLATGSSQPFTVKNCAFHANAVGVYNRGVSNATITFNTFTYLHDLLNGQDVSDQIGIYLEGLMTMIDIQENNFFDADAGALPNVNTIGICSNGLGGFTNIIRRNTFEEVTIGNIANGENSDAQGNGLLYRCNINESLLAYDIALTEGASVRATQDGPPQQNQPFSSAGNKFAYFNALLEDDITNAGAPFRYRYNQPTANDEPIEITIGKVLKENVFQENLCIPEQFLEPSIPDREQWQSDFQNAKTVWQAARQQYLTMLDGGNTFALVNMVTNASSGNIASVMNTLSSTSPWVSTRVFRTLVSKYPLVSATSIRNLILQNPDVLSDGSFWNFLKNSNLFSSPDMQNFSSATTTTTVRTTIQQSMASHKSNMDYWGTLYLNDYLHEHPDYTTSFFQSFMQGYAGYYTDALIVEELLRNGDLTQALNLVSNMGTSYCITGTELAQHTQYQQLIQVMVNAFLSGRSLYELNPTELSQIGTIHQTSSGLAKLLSGNILHGAGMLVSPFASCILPDVLPGFQEGSSDVRSDIPLAPPIKQTEGSVFCYPNPAGDFVQFNLSRLPVEMRCGQITVYDLMGKIIAYKPLAINTENIVIDTRGVPEGIYMYQVACEQHKFYWGKFMVKKQE